MRFVHADAGSYLLPDGPCCAFMFNPFDATIIRDFVETNRAHFATHGSVIGYVNDVYRLTFADLGFEVLFRDQGIKTSLHRLIRA